MASFTEDFECPWSAFLQKLGLANFYPNKLSVRSLQEINKESLSDKEVDSLQTLPWVFLRNILMVNTKSRTLVCTTDSSEINDLFDDCVGDVNPNPLDIVVALFTCADSFLQQEIALKMSMCQFAVPLLLPKGPKQNQFTLMLWALRGILKEWRPHSMSESKGFIEDNVVHAKIPLVSFVRLSNCSLSKSQIINHLLSTSQQHHNFFCHRDMVGGCTPREIANGMVELCWYLPCGKKSIDIFSDPVAIANLRGDVCKFEIEFAFLAQVSAAVFVFLDHFEQKEENLFLLSSNMTSKVFFVVNFNKENHRRIKSSVDLLMDSLHLEKEHFIVKKQDVNMANLSIKIHSAIEKSVKGHSTLSDIKSMSKSALEMGLSVDELHCKASTSAEEAAEDIMKGIGLRKIVDYKKSQLPLQGESWKRQAQIEKEECKLQISVDLSLEDYKEQLKHEKKSIQEQRHKYKITKAMSKFIKALSTNDSTERAFFIKWMCHKLDKRSRKDLAELRQKFKSLCEQKDRDAISKTDQEILDSSLGIEHYMREMGHIYEASFPSSNTFDKLPTLAAELLQQGFPLELLDGDASNIPEKWIHGVLMELHRKVGETSRLLIITVLGVQSTGKSTLLNTMFGVQFAVSSGRCTRGAYMLLLPVGEDLRSEMACDFILLIDTEGLKSPDLAQLNESYEHDNQLATFVIGLSDVTIINVAMENFTEMKDILQIAVHAFLRMKEIGKKPICLFVHQNVAGVSAHNKCMSDRKHLLDHLNEMTKIAATMEKKSTIQKFTDVLDYDIARHNWYIPGLWNGTPPMAPVNAGYSVAVFEFKQNLLKLLKERKNEDSFMIPEFLEWMSSMWRAVKFENFIFSFRNILVAHTYDNLCKEFSEWDWGFKRHIYTWLDSATTQISNTETSCLETLKTIVETLYKAGEKETLLQEKEMQEKLKNFYRRKNQHVNLVEKYKVDFIKSIHSLQKEMRSEVRNKLDIALQIKKNKAKVDNIHRDQTAMIEEKVIELLKNYKDNFELSEEDLKRDFERMWSKILANIQGLKEENIPAEMLKQLRSSFINHKVNEDMQNVTNLTDYGTGKFKVKSKKHISLNLIKKVVAKFTKNDAKQEVQCITDTAIQNCIQTIDEFSKSKGDYQTIFTQDLIEKIDKYIKQTGSKTNVTYEVDLKLHICGIAARKFLEMHRKFIADKDPVKHLEKFKAQYLSEFIDLYRRKDRCQRKAGNLSQLCLKPAITEYIEKTIGTDIVDAVLDSKYSTEYSSRSYFQYNIQKQLLEKEDFEEFARYIQNYEIYVKEWIHGHIIQCFSKDLSLSQLKKKKMNFIFDKIFSAVEKAQYGDDGSCLPNNIEGTTVLIQNFCRILSNVISLPMKTVEGVLFQNTSSCYPFINNLNECLNDLKTQLTQEMQMFCDITETFDNVWVKPHNELFKRVFGCGQRCPFCKVPCEAGGKGHEKHSAAVHRPQGLVGNRYAEDEILCEEICTSSVHGTGAFQSHETKFEPYPFKDYHSFYPEWLIPPDGTIEASDYWKYVLVKYNDKFAERYKAKPAQYPTAWNSIDKKQALDGLKSAFNIK